jgi:hypothetical protein
MARARTIKPGFFTNDDLGMLKPAIRLLFAGLWTMADRDGRLIDRPAKIKAEVLPYDHVDVVHALVELAERGFIMRYTAGGMTCIQITKWSKHQRPHPREMASELPPPPGTPEPDPGAPPSRTQDRPEPDLTCARPPSSFPSGPSGPRISLNPSFPERGPDEAPPRAAPEQTTPRPKWEEVAPGQHRGQPNGQGEVTLLKVRCPRCERSLPVAEVDDHLCELVPGEPVQTPSRRRGGRGMHRLFAPPEADSAPVPAEVQEQLNRMEAEARRSPEQMAAALARLGHA